MTTLLTRERIKARERPRRAHDDLDRQAAERIDRNIDGAIDFLQAVVADPSLLDHIPGGAEIVLEHDADPVLSAANRAASLRTQRAGHPVYVHRVRAKPPLQRGTPELRKRRVWARRFSAFLKAKGNRIKDSARLIPHGR